MRRVLGIFGISLVVGGAAALTPLLATIGAGLTLASISGACAAWRWMRHRNRA